MTTLSIQKLVYGGDGLGFFEGKACFVEGALPGETVEVEIFQSKKKFARGRMIGIVENSPHRIEPPCPYTRDCGGCQYQHVSYEEELRWKETQVREYFERELRVPADRTAAIRHAGNPHHYRNAVTLHGGSGGKAGFYARDNRTVMAVQHCLLAASGLDSVFSGATRIPNGEDASFRLAADGNRVTDQELRLFQVETSGGRFWTHSRGFFQVNLEVAGLLAAQAGLWTKPLAPHVFLDLYAGAGFFGLTAGREVEELVFIEDNPYSLEALEANLRDRKRKAQVIRGEVEVRLPDCWESLPEGKRIIFLDPPRKGMSRELGLYLGSQETAGIIYVSCHLGTLVRDLKLLLSGQRFQIQEVIPFDMFPRTKHIETAVLLTPS